MGWGTAMSICPEAGEAGPWHSQMCWLMIDKTFPSLNSLLLWWVSGAFPALLAWGQVAPRCSYSICPFPAEAWQNYFNTSEGQLPPKTAGKPSAHLTLRPQSLAQDGRSQRSGNLSQSCRHAITHWGHGSLVSHVQNMTYRAGRLRVEQPGKYYVYAQIYFRYRGAGRDSGPQLVQCIQWQPAHSPPVLLLKGVGTKCWAPEADYGLHALYQGGLFELKAGDELFVSVSSLAIDSSDTAASYFGAFRLDL
uniref:Tumor necrosis factor ligand superfamily member 10 n=1 Tax=Zonotrichia albicollis TaxID=44394 RepID=A0A8D2N396_ZONAL